MSSKLWLPVTARKQIQRCAGCGEELPYETLADKRKTQRHMATCGADEIDERYRSRMNDGFRTPMDPERHDYLRAKQGRGEKVNWYKEGLVI